MKKTHYIIIGVLILILAVGFMRFIIGGSEDSWIKGDNGVWIKHGNPSETPSYVLEQQEAVIKAKSLYSQKRSQGMEFFSQCFGEVVASGVTYAIDIVNVPRTREDSYLENQCDDFVQGKVEHFIELDKFGSVVRIV